MEKLPTVLSTFVIRSAHQGSSHGGACLIDLENEITTPVLDWNDQTIEWEGRGHGRGLRGIAFYQDTIVIAAYDDVFVFDQDFKIINAYKNAYARDLHEICINGDRLLVTATATDSVLELDLKAGKWTRGWCIKNFGAKQRPRPGEMVSVDMKFGMFDPNRAGGPAEQDTTHLNMVSFSSNTMFVCGAGMQHVYASTADGQFTPYARVPIWTHNAQPWRDGILANSTGTDTVIYQNHKGDTLRSYIVKRWDESLLEQADLPEDFARQAFGRGLCLFGDNHIVAGSSPGTISVYNADSNEVLKVINHTMDVRNAPHGLELWPW